MNKKIGKDKSNGTKLVVAEETTSRATDEAIGSSRPTRGIGGRYKAAFRNPYSTDIPDEIKEAFARKGYSLRWVRVVDAKTKTVDHERIHKFLSIGGEIVTADEMRSIDKNFLVGLTKHTFREEFIDEEEQSARGSAIGMRKGDLILMKLPMEYIEDKRAYNIEAVEETLKAKQQVYKERTGGTYDINMSSGNVNLGKEFFDK